MLDEFGRNKHRFDLYSSHGRTSRLIGSFKEEDFLGIVANVLENLILNKNLRKILDDIDSFILSSRNETETKKKAALIEQKRAEEIRLINEKYDAERAKIE